MKFKVLKSNVERMEKKLKPIMNKAKKYGCDVSFAIIGEGTEERFHDRDKRFPYYVEYIEVEVNGTAIIDNWQFVAKLEHTENGNIIRGDGNFEVPQKYYHSDGYCEHCHSHRQRKYLYVVRNTETGEFKQVGKSCLKSYTNGLSPEMCLSYMNLFEFFENEQHEYSGYIGESIKFNTEFFMTVCHEWFKHNPYIPIGDNYERSSVRHIRLLCWAYLGQLTLKDDIKEAKDLIAKFNLDPFTDENIAEVHKLWEWLDSIDDETASNYYHNLKTLRSLPNIPNDCHMIACSAFNAMKKGIQHKAVIEARKQKLAQSEKAYADFLKNTSFGDVMSVDVDQFEKVASFATQYGLMYIYKFTNSDGIVFVWKTGKDIENKPKSVTGKFKKMTVFNDERQVELNYCKLK